MSEYYHVLALYATTFGLSLRERWISKKVRGLGGIEPPIPTLKVYPAYSSLARLFVKNSLYA